VNDGAVLDDTLAGILDQYPELDSVAVVPLGLSKFNAEPAMRPHTVAEAVAVVDAVADWQDVFLAALGHRMVFASDEYYLMADRPFPPAPNYGEFPMHEDGIGMVRSFQAEFEGATSTATGPRRGFFAAVDVPPPNPAAYTGLRSTACTGTSAEGDGDPEATKSAGEVAVGLRPTRSAPIAVLTGAFGAPVIAPLIESLQRDDIRVVTVANEFFGGTTGVTGLMTGEDLSRVLRAEPVGHRYLLPDVCLSDDGRFLDGLSLDELPRPVEVVATDGIALRRSLGTRG
jgi:NifB/MoaA-like Fe-S oxidoreductase